MLLLGKGVYLEGLSQFRKAWQRAPH